MSQLSDDPSFKWRPAGSKVDWKRHGHIGPEEQRALAEEEARREGALQAAKALGLMKVDCV